MHTIQSLCPFLSKEDKKEFIAECIPALWPGPRKMFAILMVITGTVFH